jgi:hypothetical protein
MENEGAAIARDQSRNDSSLGLQHSDEGTELLELGEQLVSLISRQQLASDGLERHFPLEKRSQPLDGRLLDDCHPTPAVQS